MVSGSALELLELAYSANNANIMNSKLAKNILSQNGTLNTRWNFKHSVEL